MNEPSEWRVGPGGVPVRFGGPPVWSCEFWKVDSEKRSEEPDLQQEESDA